jgi:hypothetical protein
MNPCTHTLTLVCVCVCVPVCSCVWYLHINGYFQISFLIPCLFYRAALLQCCACVRCARDVLSVCVRFGDCRAQGRRVQFVFGDPQFPSSSCVAGKKKVTMLGRRRPVAYPVRTPGVPVNGYDAHTGRGYPSTLARAHWGEGQSERVG